MANRLRLISVTRKMKRVLGATKGVLEVYIHTGIVNVLCDCHVVLSLSRVYVKS